MGKFLTLRRKCRCSVMPARLICPWKFPGKNTGACGHFLLERIFLTQGSNPHLLHWQVDSFPLYYLECLLNNCREEDMNTSPQEADGDREVFDLTPSPFSTKGT